MTKIALDSVIPTTDIDALGELISKITKGTENVKSFCRDTGCGENMVMFDAEIISRVEDKESLKYVGKKFCVRRIASEWHTSECDAYEIDGRLFIDNQRFTDTTPKTINLNHKMVGGLVVDRLGKESVFLHDMGSTLLVAVTEEFTVVDDYVTATAQMSKNKVVPLNLDVINNRFSIYDFFLSRDTELAEDVIGGFNPDRYEFFSAFQIVEDKENSEWDEIAYTTIRGELMVDYRDLEEGEDPKLFFVPDNYLELYGGTMFDEDEEMDFDATEPNPECIVKPEDFHTILLRGILKLKK